MRRHEHNPLRHWLAAEERGDEQGAEAALFRLMRSMPREAPSRGFADRTMKAAGVVPRRRTSRALHRTLGSLGGLGARVASAFAGGRWLRKAGVAGVGVLALGLSLVFALGAVLVVRFDGLRGLTPADPFEALISTISAFWQWVASGLVLWQRAAGVGETIRGLVAAPDVAVALVLLLLIAASSLKALQAVLANDRSRMYVDSLR